jgi:hypothetical protein
MPSALRNPSPFLDSIADFMTVRRYSKRTIMFIDVKTAEIYTHVLKLGARGIRSPLSDLNSA